MTSFLIKSVAISERNLPDEDQDVFVQAVDYCVYFDYCCAPNYHLDSDCCLDIDCGAVDSINNNNNNKINKILHKTCEKISR